MDLHSDSDTANMTPNSTESHLSSGSTRKVLDLLSSDRCQMYVFIGTDFCLDLLKTDNGNDINAVCREPHILGRQGKCIVDNQLSGLTWSLGLVDQLRIWGCKRCPSACLKQC